MKQKTNNLCKIFYLCFALLLLNGCSEEKEFIENNSNSGLKFSKLPYDKLLLEANFQKAYSKIKIEKQKKVSAKSSLEDAFDFEIVEGKDAKIVEIDNRKYYNILIKREIENPANLENLLILVETVNNVDESSAFIIKYLDFDGGDYTNIYNSVQTTQLYGRVTIVKSTVCVVVCTKVTDDHPYPHTAYSPACNNYLSTMCFDFYTTNDDGGGSLPAGNSNTDTGIGQSGGGPTNYGNSGGTINNPPNQNSQTNNPPPLELILDPVVDEPTSENNKIPCNKIKKLLTDKTPTLSAELQTLSTKVSDTIEKGIYSLSNASSNVLECPNNSFGELGFPFPPAGVKILYFAHTHNSPANKTYSIFSWDDLENIAVAIKKGYVDKNFVCFLSTADGTNYAFTISDPTQFAKFFAFDGEINFDAYTAKKKSCS